MNVHDIMDALDLTVLVEGDLSRPVVGGYTGDLLSWVMGRAQANEIWITIMSNLNTIAVAVMADVSAVILAENVQTDQASLAKASTHGVTLLSSPLSSFELAGRLHRLLNR